LVAFYGSCICDPNIYFENKTALMKSGAVRFKIWFGAGIIALLIVAGAVCALVFENIETP